MLLLIVLLLGTLIYPIESLTPMPSSNAIESELTMTTSTKPHTHKKNEQPIAIEGRFIIAEGNSDHLFHPSDFIKEEAVQCVEGDTKTTKND
ncbi:unnamed protein product [Adineta ricciae]|uniref:Uncharacterized protein n=1 Tax=Adineta ricciae TaxID=249248 RepID=A0A813MV44_ADIRI|nr:unnamed protein product [Adineta ricciae]CAF0817748.1 unnamed protein product [Adineta ricciae]